MSKLNPPQITFLVIASVIAIGISVFYCLYAVNRVFGHYDRALQVLEGEEGSVFPMTGAVGAEFEAVVERSIKEYDALKKAEEGGVVVISG